MASFFDDFKEKKKKKKSLVQTVTPAKAVKAKQETKQATQTKTVSQSSKALVNKNKSFVKGYENRKKVSLPAVTKPSLPKQTMNGSLRTPVQAMGETKKRATQNTAVETRRRNQQTLSAADKKLSPVQQRAVQTYKANWDAAEARGDRAGMNLAHQRAEAVRRQQGYSGGVAGNEYISSKISQQDRNLLNDSGQMAMKQAKLDFDRASAAGNTLAMKEAILEMTALRKGEKYRSMDMQSAVGTDAYGRPIYGKTQREQLMGEAMGKGVAGGLLSLRETANTALRNQARQRWTADKTPEMVNPNALGQRLMRESNMAGAMATQDLSGGKKLLAETAISMGQMLPGMAASAIPVVGPAIGAAMLSGQAAGAKAFELNERGIDPGEALTRGLISGGIEGLTEAIPLARLGNILTGSAGRSLVKNVLGQMAIEGTEESISYTLNYLADKAAKDPEAVWSWDELKRNALAGAIAGGTLAGAGTLFNPNAQNAPENARRAFNVQNNGENVGTGLVRDDYTNSQDKQTMDEIDEISKRLGLTVQFADRVAGGAANASIRGNVVTIERNNLNPVRFLYGHEVAHFMQEASPDAYTNFRAVIANEKEVSDRVEEIMAEGGMNWDQALDEVTADYAGTLIENERILQRFIQENQKNKPMLQRLADAFRGLLQKLTGKDKVKVQNAVEALKLALEETVKGNRLRTGKEARIENRRAKQTQRWQENRREDLIQRLIQDYPTMEGEMKAQVDNLGIEGVVDAYLNGGNNPVLAAYEEAQTRYSFKRAGDTRQAEEMEAQGADRETIWQATGQTRDTKGNWVEEVDDSKAKFYHLGDAKRQGNPDWVRLKELESKMLDGSITQEELEEANALAQNLRGMPKGSTLGDYLHEVMAKEKGAPASFQTGATAEAARLPGDAESPSDTSIPQTEGESNEKLSDKALSSYERAYEMVYKRPLEKPNTVQQAAEQASVGVIDRLQNLEPPKAESKAKPLPKPGERKVEEVQEDPIPAEDLAYMDELLDSAQDRDLEAEFRAARDLIPGGVTDKTSMREKGKDIGGYAYRKLVDSGDEIRKAGKQSGDKYLYFYYNQAKASTATAQNMIAMRQSDVNGKEVGESLVNIFGPIKKKGKEYFTDFQDYLLHRHNIQRMGTPEERQMQKQARRFLYDFEDMHPEYKDMTLPVLREASDGGDQIAKEYLEIRKEKEFWDSRVKPVFNYEMTPEKSQTRAKQYEASHPEFKELAQRVYQYNRNLMQYRVDSGLISQETADFLQKKYPNYVPTFHKQDGVSTAPQEKGTRVGKTVKKATGSTGDTPFIDMDKAIAQQTMSVVRESAKNRFGQRLLNKDISQDYIINVESLAQKKQLAEMHDEDGFLAEQTNKDNTFTVYQNGKAYEITMTPAMYEGIKSLSPKRETDNLAVKVIIGTNNIYKKAITSWNLIFTAKNFVKDFQDSLLYSKDLKGFGLNYFPAIKQILGNGDEWKLYQALGGTASSVYNSDQGVRLPSDKPISKMMGKVAFLNLAVEQWPRMAEFMATVKKGNRTQEELMEAMYRAADITTNFGRSGDVTKMLNSSFVPFLNPSIQGVDKIRRTIMENPREVGPWVALIGKAALLGIAPAVINYLAAGDEEDYDQLNQRDLDNNYMFPMGGKKEERDRYWIKVPKGRALAAIGAVANAGINAARGKEVDKKDLIDVVWNNIGFVNPLSGNIVKAWMDADLLDENSPGKTWYGSDIESQSMQTKRASERYNEKTDEISKLVGKVTGKSPTKINYLLDSYTGVLGDFILPWATKNDTASIAGRLASPFVKPFVLDSTTSNRLSGDFYELGDELTYSKQDGSYEDAILVKYWNKASQELAEVNDKIHKMEKNTALGSKEKRQKYRDLKAQANQIMLETMSNMKTFRETAANYIAERTPEDGKKLYLTDKEQEDIFLQVTRDLFGAEQTLKYMGDDDYKRAQKANQAGVEYDTYLDFKDLMKRYDAIYDAEAALKYEDVEGTSETQFRRAAQQRVDKLHEKEADLIKVYSEGDTGWGTSPKHHKLAILADMELPLHEAVALWYTQILSNDDARNDADMREFKSLTKEQQYEYYQAVKFLNGYEDPKNPGHTKSKSRQNQIIPVIKSMGLTPRQKEIIWTDIENWSAKTLYLVR